MDTEKLLKEFNEWADNSILDCSIPPLSESHKVSLQSRSDAYKWAKFHLARIVKELND